MFCLDVLGNDKQLRAGVSGHIDDSIAQFFNIPVLQWVKGTATFKVNSMNKSIF